MEQIINQAISDILIALIGLAGTYIAFAISKASIKVKEATAKNIKDEAQRKLIDDAFNRVTILASNVVAHTQQVSVATVKQAIADGKVDKSELETLGKQAVDSVYGQLNTDTVSLLETELSDVKGYIESVVEAQVLKLKNDIK